MSKYSRIVFVGQFPPPINGLTIITSRLASALEAAGYDIAAVNTAVPASRRSVLFHASRLAKAVRAMTSIASNALSGKSRVCYFTPLRSAKLCSSPQFQLYRPATDADEPLAFLRRP
jgi:hypothetical protein